jgi:hypothetical protein
VTRHPRLQIKYSKACVDDAFGKSATAGTIRKRQMSRNPPNLP